VLLVYRVADGGFSATVRHDREGKRGNGFGQHDGLVAETDKDLLAAGVGVVDRQPADRGGPLGVTPSDKDATSAAVAAGTMVAS
jgi:hypothetical protein